MEDYLAALASHSSQADVQQILERATAGATGPLSRIRRLAAISFDSTIFRLDRAMRVWGTSDPRAAASIKASKRLVLAFLVDAFAGSASSEKTRHCAPISSSRPMSPWPATSV